MNILTRRRKLGLMILIPILFLGSIVILMRGVPSPLDLNVDDSANNNNPNTNLVSNAIEEIDASNLNIDQQKEPADEAFVKGVVDQQKLRSKETHKGILSPHTKTNERDNANDNDYNDKQTNDNNNNNENNDNNDNNGFDSNSQIPSRDGVPPPTPKQTQKQTQHVHSSEKSVHKGRPNKVKEGSGSQRQKPNTLPPPSPSEMNKQHNNNNVNDNLDGGESNISNSNNSNNDDDNNNYEPFKYNPENEVRREAVKDAFLHCWNAYKKYAWGRDELKPISHTPTNWMRMGLTIIDSLDTIYLMDLKDEFNLARDWVASDLRFDTPETISFFETTIRIVGGLLSAYDLSKDKIFLDKANELAKKMLPVFDTRTGIPRVSINLLNGQSSNPDWNGRSSVLSEAGTIQVEYSYLSHHTKNPEFRQKAFRVIEALNSIPKPWSGLYPVHVNPETGAFSRNLITLGALGDSFYEYLLKVWLITGKKEKLFQQMYLDTAKAIQNNLIRYSTPSNLMYIAELDGGVIDKMDHLVCFAGGMFALGAYHKIMGDDVDLQNEHMRIGKGITRTCHEMYKRQVTGLAPELVRFYPNSDMRPGASHYILRPETVESFFVLYRITGNPIYQEWGWEAFQAMVKHCKVDEGFSGIRDVSNSNSPLDDLQQSFFMAETLKYLYLLFSPTDLIPLNKYVFNTEAHPLSMFS